MENQTLAEDFAAWVSHIEYSQIPQDVIDVSKFAMLDVVAVGSAGSKSQVAQSALNLALHFFSERAGGASTFCGKKLSFRQAAYVNVAAGHALDMDDTSYAGIAHVSVIVAPVVLAYAEDQHLSAENLLTAFVAGSEIAYALGAAAGSRIYENNFWPTGVLGAVAAATALGKLKGLDAHSIARGIAFAALNATAFRCMQGTDCKPLAAAEAAKRAIDAVTIAQSNVSIPLDVFESCEGPLNVTTNGRFDHDLARQLGHRWRLIDPGLVVKLYPLCSCAQTAVQALLGILHANHLSGADIKSVSVTTTSMVSKTLKYDLPQNENQAMFSLTFPLACVLVDGDITPEHISAETTQRRDILAAMKLISSHADDDLFDLDESPEAVIVEVKTNQDNIIRQRLLFAVGDPRSPLTRQQRRHKIQRCLDHADVEKLMAAFDKLEQHENVSELTRYFNRS